MATISTEKKVGMTILAGFLCLIALVLFISRAHLLFKGYRVKVMFHFVDSLKADAPVLFGGGVRIGQVEKIEQEGSLVKVTCLIRQGNLIPKDALVSINTTGILGEKYVQVNSGEGAGGNFEDGATVEGIDPGSLDRMLQGVEKLSAALMPLLQDPEVKDSIGSILKNSSRLTADLADLISKSREDAREAMANFNKASQKALRVADNMDEMTSVENRRNLQQALKHLNGTLTKLDKALAQVEAQKGTVGALVYDEEAAENLRQLLRDLKNHPWKLLWKK